MSEREYYLAEGEDLVKANTFIEERQMASSAIDALAKKHGGQAVINGYCIIGLTLDKMPQGWTKKGEIEGKPFYMPKRTTKALREIHADLRSVKLKGAHEFHAMMCGGGGVFAPGGNGPGVRVLYTVWEWIGDTLLLSVPVGADFTPNGSRKLKMSEYWALKEAEPSDV